MRLATDREAVFSSRGRDRADAASGPELAVLQHWAAADPGVERARLSVRPALRNPLDAALLALSLRLSLSLAGVLAVARRATWSTIRSSGTLAFLQEPARLAAAALAQLTWNQLGRLANVSAGVGGPMCVVR